MATLSIIRTVSREALSNDLHGIESMPLTQSDIFYEFDIDGASPVFEWYSQMVYFCKVSDDPAKYLLEGQVADGMGWVIDEFGRGFWFFLEGVAIFADVFQRRLFATSEVLPDNWDSTLEGYFLAF